MSIRKHFRVASVAGVAIAAALVSPSAGVQALERVDQGIGWTEGAWNDFYSRGQGSRLIPWDWIKALKQPNGQSFTADGLARYGYLPNPASPTPGLPVGFVVADGYLGPTCAACHTREIEVDGKSWRIDGGPALADIGALWADFDTAVGKILGDGAAFTDFAKAVLGASYSPQRETALHSDVDAWFARHNAITKGGLPTDKPWGPGRLDAVGMILNRVTGLDIGPPPSHMIPENIRRADAPVRPPFLWNAPKQDHTQWPGFADNGDRILAMARNLGQVYGVFGEFFPRKDASHLLGFNYVDNNSADFMGLIALEHLVEKMGPPKWPWPVDKALAERGKEIFERSVEDDGCADCHGIKPGQPRVLNKDTWCTPVQDVGTDSREYKYLAPEYTAKTGALTGAAIPFVSPPLKPVDSAVAVLSTSVKGAILQHFLPVTLNPAERLKADLTLKLLQPVIEELKGVYKLPDQSSGAKWTCAAPQTEGKIRYEARVLEGIWAAAPYLHNGSAPSLVELLKPAKDRVASFKIGPAYDVVNVGLAADQPKSAYTMKTTDCSDRNSGDSRCGHEYGTTKLTTEERKALLEYLKTL
ncbi:di-heme-cytochrome C peroxidase [Methylocystis sp. ATCC 49242]|uniref:di-heme-cytochrome C peroxidase n=1 Tax=Methylocystis sp. ATCC 49242 TaxID=622637 RepID=UPI0001F87FB7|nr:di-heme-cytochrome C peroxidase [Methylocystis sp. ATCC 49242]